MMKSKLLSAPYIVWMILFTLVPLGVVFYYAFTDWSQATRTMREVQFVGFDNFRRIFTDSERAEAAAREAEGGPQAATRYFAGRFAIKEAVAKALNACEVAVEFPQIETLAAETGAPMTRLVGDAARLDGRCKLHVSLSHEENVVIAFCVVEER